MLKYILRVMVGTIPTLLIVITLSFFITRFAPGNPLDSDRPMSPITRAKLEQKYHFDKPILVQYGIYLSGLIQGDFGYSYHYKNQKVWQIIGSSLYTSFIFGSITFIFVVTIGLLFGLLSAIKRNSFWDYFFMSVGVIGVTVPSFVIGPILMYVFAMRLNWLPTSGWIQSGGDWVKLIMPVTTLGLYYVAFIARIFRSSILNIINQEFIITARAKGLSEFQILLKHLIRPAVIPIVSYLGPVYTSLLTGSIVVEGIFRIPGLGQHVVNSALNRDYPTIMAIVIVYAVLLILFNLVVDIIYGVLDPRIRYH